MYSLQDATIWLELPTGAVLARGRTPGTWLVFDLYIVLLEQLKLQNLITSLRLPRQQGVTRLPYESKLVLLYYYFHRSIGPLLAAVRLRNNV